MAAHAGLISFHQVALVAATTSAAIALPTTRDPGSRCAIAAPSSRTAPVHFAWRGAGDTTTEPTTRAAGTSGTGSPAMLPGLALDLDCIPPWAVSIVLKSIEAGDVWVQFYEQGGA